MYYASKEEHPIEVIHVASLEDKVKNRIVYRTDK